MELGPWSRAWEFPSRQHWAGEGGRERQEEGDEPCETSLSTKQGAGAESALFVNVLRDSAFALWVFSALAYTGEGREAEHEVHTPVSFQHQKSQSPANSDASKPHHRAAHRQKKALLSRPPSVLGQKSSDYVTFAEHAPSSPRRHLGRQTQHLQDKNSVHCSAALCSSGRHRPGQPPRCSHRSAEVQRVKLVRQKPREVQWPAQGQEASEWGPHSTSGLTSWFHSWGNKLKGWKVTDVSTGGSHFSSSSLPAVAWVSHLLALGLKPRLVHQRRWI